MMVVLKGLVPMAFGGTQEPAAYGELVSIGGLNPDVNKKLSADIASIVESKLSIPKFPLLPQVPVFKALGLWMELIDLLDGSYGVESCMSFRVRNILSIAYLRRSCSKMSCQFNGQCL
uniref:Uncharacterized protein n=1 Tax=Aegilops tauschii subsp. strangulata TaxID=200361 RepID=A0A453LJQ0_AEGTS